MLIISDTSKVVNLSNMFLPLPSPHTIISISELLRIDVRTWGNP